MNTMETQTATIVMSPKKFRPKSYTAAMLPDRIICMIERSRLTSLAASYFKLRYRSRTSNRVDSFSERRFYFYIGKYLQIYLPRYAMRESPARCYYNTFSLFWMGLGGETLKIE